MQKLKKKYEKLIRITSEIFGIKFLCRVYSNLGSNF